MVYEDITVVKSGLTPPPPPKKIPASRTGLTQLVLPYKHLTVFIFIDCMQIDLFVTIVPLHFSSFVGDTRTIPHLPQYA